MTYSHTSERPKKKNYTSLGRFSLRASFRCPMDTGHEKMPNIIWPVPKQTVSHGGPLNLQKREVPIWNVWVFFCFKEFFGSPKKNSGTHHSPPLCLSLKKSKLSRCFLQGWLDQMGHVPQRLGLGEKSSCISIHVFLGLPSGRLGSLLRIAYWQCWLVEDHL